MGVALNSALLLLMLPLLFMPDLLPDGLPEIVGFPQPSVPTLSPRWMQGLRDNAVFLFLFGYPLSLWVAARWAGRLRRHGQFALTLLPLALPVLVGSPLLAIFAADHYREATAPAEIRDMATDGSHAWITASSDNERNVWLSAIDLPPYGQLRERSVTSLRRRGSWVFTEPRQERWRIVGVTGRALVLQDLNDGLSVVDLQSKERFYFPSSHYQVAALAYPNLLLAMTFDGILVCDPTTPRSMPILARMPRGHSETDFDPQRVQAMDGGRALVSQNEEVWVFDLADPAHPRRRGKWVANAAAGEHVNTAELATTGTSALMLSDPMHLLVIDFSDLDHPVEAGRLTLPKPVHRLTASGILAAVATMEEPAEVLLVDLSQPKAPTLAGRVSSPGRRFAGKETEFRGNHPAFALVGTQLLVAAGDRLEIFDASQPSRPHWAHGLQLNGF